MYARPPVPQKGGSVLSPRMSGIEAQRSRNSKPPEQEERAHASKKDYEPADVLSQSDDEYEPEKLSDDDNDEQLAKNRQGPLPRGNSAIFFRPFNPDANSAGVSPVPKKSSTDDIIDDDDVIIVSDAFVDDLSISINDRPRSGTGTTDQRPTDQRPPDQQSGEVLRKKTSSQLASGEEPTPKKLSRVQSMTSGGQLPNMRKSMNINGNMSFLKKRESLQNGLSASSRGSRQTSRGGSVKAPLSGTNSRFVSSDRTGSLKNLDTSFRKSKGAVKDGAAQLGASGESLTADAPEPPQTGGMKRRTVSGWLRKHFK
eukprot:CAMPEP_0185848720 /NCGR_PEP_ID=MMETSP1354-20130828/3492_1 /TAXON_ID=708628 /ORGANISM="Erythrolobus madagascarensis, Strain CCMP3276" /LENGTH=312 /DNA_ID=CAMNT_0028549153 /DNA_START=160 /DNA_END=1098 /DNA_ORIENTATION=-